MKITRKWAIILLVLLAVGVGSYLTISQISGSAESVEDAPLQTAVVRRGDIIISVEGSGTVYPAEEANLKFGVSGVLAELLVEIGDHVDAGDVLARLDDSDAQLTLAQIELDVKDIQADLGTATVDAEQDLNYAYGTLAIATAATDIATNDDVTATRIALERAEADLAYSIELASDLVEGDYRWDAWWADVDNKQGSVDIAQSAYNVAVEAVDDDLQSARWSVGQAQLNLEGAQGDLLTGQRNLADTELELESAQLAMQDYIMITPISGTVAQITGSKGESITDTLITVIDLDAPLVLFFLEEIDFDKVTIGNPVQITFTMAPDNPFVGTIFRVDPELTTIDETPALQIWASIDISENKDIPVLSGMSADVEVIAGESLDTLLVPVQALRELSPGSYAVFLVDDLGELELRPVKVGLVDFANAEILDGLTEGDVVSTGIVDTE